MWLNEQNECVEFLSKESAMHIGIFQIHLNSIPKFAVQTGLNNFELISNPDQFHTRRLVWSME